jgi:hypothetical protein
MCLESWATGEMGDWGYPKLPICTLAILMAVLSSSVSQPRGSLSAKEYLDLGKCWCIFCRVGLRLVAMEPSEYREWRLMVEHGESESLLDMGLTG